MIWYVEEDKTKVSYGNTIPRNFAVWYVEENFRIDELQCCSDVEVLVCKAVKKGSSVGGQKKIGVD